MARLADTQPMPITSELAPLSEPAVLTWETYAKLYNPEKDQDKAKVIERSEVRSIEIAQVLFDFGGLKGLVNSTYEAAAVVELAEKLNSSDRFEAASALVALNSYASEILTDPKDPESAEVVKARQDREYVLAIAMDIQEINSFIDEHFESELSEYDPSYDEQLDPWNYKHKMIPFYESLELIAENKSKYVKNPKGVNIESVLIGAASAHNTLRNARDFSEYEVLKTIYAVKKFYIPLFAFMGYDAYEAELYRRAGFTAMEYGHGAVTQEELDEARALLEELRLNDPENVLAIVQNTASDLFKRDVTVKSVLHNTSGHNLVFGVGKILGEEDPTSEADDETDIDDDTLDFQLRVKTDYSIAENIHKKPGEYISDILGLSVKLPLSNYEVLADKMTIALGVLSQSRKLKPKNSASRDTHIHAKGEDVVHALLPVLQDNLDGFEWHIDKKDSVNGHQYAKLTMQSDLNSAQEGIPTEVQFQTIDDRDIARFGTAAHVGKSEGYQAVVGPDKVAITREINTRRTMVNEVRLTEQSRKRAEKKFAPRKVKKVISKLGSAGMRRFALPEETTY